MQKSLHLSEWTFFLVIFFLVTTVVITSKIKAFQAASFVDDAAFATEDVLVGITGAVKNGGVFKVVPGTALRDVVKKARPLPFADLQKLPLSLRVDSAIDVVVEELKEIEVRVCGEVEEAELRLPVGSRLSDLKDRVKLKKGADKSSLRGRKKLKNGEVVTIKKKPIEVN